MRVKNCSNASSPPAEAPMPTMGKFRAPVEAAGTARGRAEAPVVFAVLVAVVPVPVLEALLRFDLFAAAIILASR
jgi:hypothetical protein